VIKCFIYVENKRRKRRMQGGHVALNKEEVQRKEIKEDLQWK